MDMPGEPNPFGRWASESLPRGSSRWRLSSRSEGPAAPLWLRAALVLAVAASTGMVVIELARLGPFAPSNVASATAPATGSTTQTTPLALVLAPALPQRAYQWQFLATGTPTGGTSGSVEVRAWQLTSTCGPHAPCTIQMARQLQVPNAPNQASDRAMLQPGPDTATADFYATQFPPVSTRCLPSGAAGASTPSSAVDRFNISWTASTGALGAVQTSNYTCNGSAYVATYDWTADRVPAPALPALAASAHHAATDSAFLRAADAVCTDVNEDAEPIARAVAAAEHTVRTATSPAAKARADASIAKLLPSLLPLAATVYTQTPQPPTGRLDELWLRDVSLNREQLGPASALLAAFAGAAGAASSFFVHGDAADEQRALAEVFLAETTRPSCGRRHRRAWRSSSTVCTCPRSASTRPRSARSSTRRRCRPRPERRVILSTACAAGRTYQLSAAAKPGITVFGQLTFATLARGADMSSSRRWGHTPHGHAVLGHGAVTRS